MRFFSSVTGYARQPVCLRPQCKIPFAIDLCQIGGGEREEPALLNLGSIVFGRDRQEWPRLLMWNMAAKSM